MRITMSTLPLQYHQASNAAGSAWDLLSRQRFQDFLTKGAS